MTLIERLSALFKSPVEPPPPESPPANTKCSQCGNQVVPCPDGTCGVCKNILDAAEVQRVRELLVRQKAAEGNARRVRELLAGQTAAASVGMPANPASQKLKAVSPGGLSGTCAKCGKRMNKTVMVFGSVGPNMIGRRELCAECLAAAAESGRIA